MRLIDRAIPLATLLLAHPAAANVPPSADPALRVPGVDQVLSEQERRTSRDDAFSPTTGGAATPRAPALPDGTPIVRLPGRLAVADDGSLLFRPTDASAGIADPLTVMPGAARERLLKLLAAEGSIDVLITGQFYGYRHRALILVSTFVRAEGAADAPTSHPPHNEPNPTALDLAGRLESARVGPRALDRRAEAAPRSESRLREGEILTGRTGRLVTGPDGEPALAFDNDPDSPARPPLRIMPCRMRERLEAVLGGRAEGPRLRASGRLLVENDQAYLLPTFFQILPDSDLITRQ
jgi:hypothetical protein